MDWKSETTKKHIAEAKAAGLTLLGPGRTSSYRLYRFNTCGHEREIHTSVVRAYNPKCDPCRQDKLKKEAKAAGLTLLGPGRTYSYRLYRFNDCGHEQEITKHSIRRSHQNNFKCDACLQAKLRKKAKAKGLTLLGQGKKRSCRLYRFNTCGHEQEIRPAKIRTNNFRCDQCLQAKLKKEAKAAGLTLLGLGRTSSYRLYRFNTCGHEQEFQPGHVLEGRFRCDQCLKVKLKKEAKAAGLTLLGPGRNSHYRLYRFNTCGHEQEVHTYAVRENNFLCHQCEETSLDLPSHVYFIEIRVGKENWLKLGHAKTVSSRIKQYGLPKSAKLTKLVMIDFETGREAHEYESSLHTKYKRRRLPVKRMKKFHTKNGFNECYPMKMLDTLMDELNSIKT